VTERLNDVKAELASNRRDFKFRRFFMAMERRFLHEYKSRTGWPGKTIVEADMAFQARARGESLDVQHKRLEMNDTQLSEYEQLLRRFGAEPQNPQSVKDVSGCLARMAQWAKVEAGRWAHPKDIKTREELVALFDEAAAPEHQPVRWVQLIDFLCDFPRAPGVELLDENV
jgi:hypothetical protein